MAEFRTVLITEPGKDFSMVLEEAERIQYACNGFEDPERMTENIQDAVKDFDPEKDAWIPVGRIAAVAEIALTMARMYPDARICIGVYAKGEYTWQRV